MILKLKQTPALYLVGFMGCGKSTIGAALAEELGWRYVDLDAEIERAAGAAISTIFDAQGEAAFRSVETAALRKQVELVKAGRPAVIALGGGAFTIPENFGLAQHHGITIWLDAPFDVIVRRVALENHRPLARDAERMKQLYEARLSSYARADYRVETGNEEPLSVVARIMALPLFIP